MPAGATHTTAHPQRGKADFEAIYNCPDPRRYFTTLRPLDYQTPHHGQPVFRALTEALWQLRRRPDGAAPQVLDLCCSYGVNAALLNHRLTLTDLYRRYALHGLASLAPRQLAERDAAFFVRQRRPEAVRVIGLDAAPQAVGYAQAAGLLHRGFCENLETHRPTTALRRAMAGTDLITVTGGVGYVSARTFDLLLDCATTPPWVAAFVLRTVSYAAFEAQLARAGLVTERLTACTFPQRRFTGAQEQRAALEALARRGLDPSGKESDGFYHADLYLSRPAADAAALPLERLLPYGLHQVYPA